MRQTIEDVLAVVWLLLIAAIASAQPSATIVGPKEAPAGEMVILSSTGSNGDNLIWVKPDQLQTLSVGCSLLDSQIVFATTKPGSYEFWLIVADKEARISYARHTVKIAGGVNPPPVDPPPVDPPPVDPSKWANLQVLSKANADKANDATTRAKLKAAIAASVLDIETKAPSLDAAKDTIRRSIELTLLSRTGASMGSDWIPWRKANQAELDRLGLVDVKDYILAVKAIGSGL